jgi:hypothetical protein
MYCLNIPECPYNSSNEAHMLVSISDSWQLWQNATADGNLVAYEQVKANNESTSNHRDFRNFTRFQNKIDFPLYRNCFERN